jgi:hypothetical protein
MDQGMERTAWTTGKNEIHCVMAVGYYDRGV